MYQLFSRTIEKVGRLWLSQIGIMKTLPRFALQPILNYAQKRQSLLIVFFTMDRSILRVSQTSFEHKRDQSRKHRCAA